MNELRPEPLTAAAFAPYGDVIESATAVAEEMNARSERMKIMVKDLNGVITGKR